MHRGAQEALQARLLYQKIIFSIAANAVKSLSGWSVMMHRHQLRKVHGFLMFIVQHSLSDPPDVLYNPAHRAAKGRMQGLGIYCRACQLGLLRL